MRQIKDLVSFYRGTVGTSWIVAYVPTEGDLAVIMSAEGEVLNSTAWLAFVPKNVQSVGSVYSGTAPADEQRAWILNNTLESTNKFSKMNLEIPDGHMLVIKAEAASSRVSISGVLAL